jgi:hypothetical protein
MEGVSLMRKKMTASIIAAVLAVTAAVTGIGASPERAYACSQESYTTPEFDYQQASNVFYGMVMDVESVYYQGKPYRMATFVAKQNLKGEYVRYVLTSPDTLSCGVTFELGHDYLVYANNRLGPAVVNEYDVVEGDEAVQRLESLQDLGSVPIPDPGVHQITLISGMDVMVNLDGKQVPMYPAPVFRDNSIYVPITFFRDSLGYVTIWNTEAERYEILLENEWAGLAAKGDPAQSEFNAGWSAVPDTKEPFEASVTFSDVVAKVEGMPFSQEIRPFNLDGVVYVPLRQASERLGLTVKWYPEINSVFLKDTRTIDRYESPLLMMRLSSNTGGDDLLVEKLSEGQATYRVDGEKQTGEQPQLTAPIADLLQDRSIRLVLRKGARENELIISQALMDGLLKDPDMIPRLGLVIGTDSYLWPDIGIARQSTIR